MSTLAVANQYAKALLEGASKPTSGVTPEAALVQFAVFADTLAGSAELRTILLSPAVAIAAKQKVLGRIAGMLELHSTVRNFLLVITRHRRLDLIEEIRDRYQALLDAQLGLHRAGVSSALPLDDARKQVLESALARITGKQIRCLYQVDPSLVGGLAVRVGSTVFDGSIRGQLEGLRRRLSE